MEKSLSPDEKKALQIAELEIIEELKRICEKHNLRYFLTAGTLLGAVRHSGFIPWDDDIDIAMPKRDYKRLSKICKKELSEKFFFQNEKTDKNYPFLFSKIRMNGTEVCETVLTPFDIHKGIYLDIFPLDKCPRNDFFAKCYFKTIELFNCALISKYNKDFKCMYEKRIARFAFFTIRLLPKPMLRFLRRASNLLLTVFASGKRLATVSGSHGYPRETYEAKWFDKAVLMNFEGRNYPAPEGWHELLSNMYGNYMSPPEQENRTGHFKRN